MVLLCLFAKMNTACLVTFVYSNYCIFYYVGCHCQSSLNVCVRAEKPYLFMFNVLSSLYLTFIKFTTLLKLTCFVSW